MSALTEERARLELEEQREALTETMETGTLAEKLAAEAAVDVAQEAVMDIVDGRRLQENEGDVATAAEIEVAQLAIDEAKAKLDNFTNDLMCAGPECIKYDDEAACCEKCSPGQFRVEDSPDECSACAVNTRSNAGFGHSGSTDCEPCGGGTYSEEGWDHCLDCAPIFGCAAKVGMAKGDANQSTIGGDGSCETDDDCAAQAMEAGDGMVCEAQTEGRLAGKSKCVFSGTADADAGSMDQGEHGNIDSGLVFTDSTVGDDKWADSDDHKDFDVKAEDGPQTNNNPTRRLALAGGPSKLSSGGTASDTNGSTCTDGANSICTTCVIGYSGSMTNACTKCPEVQHCKYPRGHKLGPSCEKSDPLATLKCGQCSLGYFGDLCEGCPAVTGCPEANLLCNLEHNSGESFCSACDDGYFMTELAEVPKFESFEAAEMVGECTACDAIDNCEVTSCTGANGSVCAVCDDGYMAVEDTCGKLEFDAEAGVWTALKP